MELKISAKDCQNITQNSRLEDEKEERLKKKIYEVHDSKCINI